MEMNFDDMDFIDKIARDAFEDFEMPYQDGDWELLEKELDKGSHRLKKLWLIKGLEAGLLALGLFTIVHFTGIGGDSYIGSDHQTSVTTAMSNEANQYQQNNNIAGNLQTNEASTGTNQEDANTYRSTQLLSGNKSLASKFSGNNGGLLADASGQQGELNVFGQQQDASQKDLDLVNKDLKKYGSNSLSLSLSGNQGLRAGGNGAQTPRSFGFATNNGANNNSGDNNSMLPPSLTDVDANDSNNDATINATIFNTDSDVIAENNNNTSSNNNTADNAQNVANNQNLANADIMTNLSEAENDLDNANQNNALGLVLLPQIEGVSIEDPLIELKRTSAEEYYRREVRVGIYAGVDANMATDYGNPNIGYTVGTNFDIELGEFFAVGTGLAFSHKSYESTSSYNSELPDAPSYVIKEERKMNVELMQVPLNFQAYLFRDKNWRLGLQAGLVGHFAIGKSLRGTQRVQENGLILHNQLNPRNYDRGLLQGGSWFDNAALSVGGGLLFERQIANEISLAATLGYQYGVTPFAGSKGLSSLSATVGIKKGF